MRSGSSIVLTSARRSGERPVASDSAFSTSSWIWRTRASTSSERCECSGNARMSAVIAGPLVSWLRNSALARATPSTRMRSPLVPFAIWRMMPTVPTRLRSSGPGSSPSPSCNSRRTMRSPASARFTASTDTGRLTARGATVSGNTTDRRSGRTGSSEGSCGVVPVCCSAFGLLMCTSSAIWIHVGRRVRIGGQPPGHPEREPRDLFQLLKIDSAHVVLRRVVIGMEAGRQENRRHLLLQKRPLIAAANQVLGIHVEVLLDREPDACVLFLYDPCEPFAVRVPEQMDRVHVIRSGRLRQPREPEIVRIRHVLVPPDHVHVHVGHEPTGWLRVADVVLRAEIAFLFGVPQR